jgi:hypothetical protein
MSGTRMAVLLGCLMIFLLPSYSFGDSYQCQGGKVVTDESTFTDVLSKCGPPSYVDKKTEGADMIDVLSYRIGDLKLDKDSGRRKTSKVIFILVNSKVIKIRQEMESALP